MSPARRRKAVRVEVSDLENDGDVECILGWRIGSLQPNQTKAPVHYDILYMLKWQDYEGEPTEEPERNILGPDFLRTEIERLIKLNPLWPHPKSAAMLKDLEEKNKDSKLAFKTLKRSRSAIRSQRSPILKKKMKREEPRVRGNKPQLETATTEKKIKEEESVNSVGIDMEMDEVPSTSRLDSVPSTVSKHSSRQSSASIQETEEAVIDKPRRASSELSEVEEGFEEDLVASPSPPPIVHRIPSLPLPQPAPPTPKAFSPVAQAPAPTEMEDVKPIIEIPTPALPKSIALTTPDPEPVRKPPLDWDMLGPATFQIDFKSLGAPKEREDGYKKLDSFFGAEALKGLKIRTERGKFIIG